MLDIITRLAEALRAILHRCEQPPNVGDARPWATRDEENAAVARAALAAYDASPTVGQPSALADTMAVHCQQAGCQQLGIIAAVPTVGLTNSQHFAAFIDALRNSGTEVIGTNAQVASLFACALDIIEPDALGAIEDADTLSMDMHVVAEALGGEVDYPDIDEEDDEDGTSGQDRKTYSDTQDRDNYSVTEED